MPAFHTCNGGVGAPAAGFSAGLLGRLRARMLQDAALASQVADLRRAPDQERPACPSCGSPLEPRSQEKRDLATHRGQTITLDRTYAVCPHCGEAFFPPR